MKKYINKITCGDCLDLMKEIPDKSIDLTITSPPYDNLRDYKGYTFDFENIAQELFRITKDGGKIVWIVKDAVIEGSETGTSFKQALYFKEIGFNLHDTMIWLKDTFNFPDVTRYRDCFEYMFIFSKGKLKTFNPIIDRKNKWGGCSVHGTSRQKDGSVKRKSKHNKGYVKDFGIRFNVWEVSTEKNNVYGHPAIFPEKLANDHILSWSNEGDIVFDPMCGSGTTCKMAKQLNRNFIGFEISQEYVDIANKRLNQENLNSF